MKSIIFTTLLTVAATLGAAVAARAVELAWRRVRHEPPPKPSRWAARIVARPLTKRLTRRVHAPAV